MHKKSVDVVLIALSSPILVGVYRKRKLFRVIKTDEKSSEALCKIYDEILREYDVKSLFYARGPGSFMSIKIAYIFLKTLSILKKIPFYATDAFYFNENQPIKAIGKLYFVKISSKIQTQKLDKIPSMEFKLPQKLEYDEFGANTTPLYSIGAVG